ncbi:hydrolase [Fimbriiglobus ruber]|uniref:Nicotinamidase/isochorismatase family protein n=1 Tax=Fimbriiglobus ruber TaxID=1908690 RepID=A0A225DK73_9BACT|nr:hydrolase [Fimbriiglobus ruber]OWK36557.1 Nicotinamidase/isochorismatase family protein [Fimbriiglobus ruber]
MIRLNPTTTALVLIDLQNGVVGRPLAPRSGSDVVRAGGELAGRFRQAGALVVLVNVSWADDGRDALRQLVDKPRPVPPPGGFPEGWSDLVDGLARPGDLLVTKHQWGAFFGTALDLQLRRRGIKTIVLGGIATNMGVESTARQAWEHAYEVVVAEDATAGLSAEMHAFAIGTIFPMISRVTTTSNIELGND